MKLIKEKFISHHAPRWAGLILKVYLSDNNVKNVVLFKNKKVIEYPESWNQLEWDPNILS